MAQQQHGSRMKLLDATLRVVRSKGYTAARIDDICSEAGVTKGSFFHHFKSKADLALAAAAHWDSQTGAFFAEASYHDANDPVDRLVAYVEFRKALLVGDLPEFTCFAGTIIQEAYRTHPDISDACAASVIGHAKRLEEDVAAAIDQHGAQGDWTAEGLALHIQAVIQGAFVLAKATGGSAVALQSLDHLRRYLELLFRDGERRDPQTAPDARAHTQAEGVA